MITDVSAKDAFAALTQDSNAVLLDVRTPPEQAFVGTPSLENCQRISFTLFPPSQPDPNFVANVEAAIGKDQPVYCLCKLGGRSMAAGQALVAAGYNQVFNIVHGFDGDQNAAGQRRTINGWAADGLPWHQS